MTFFPQYHRRALEDDGYLVIPPTDPRPLPIYDDESAIRFVRSLGYTAIKTRLPSPPRVGTCWVPRKGKGSAYACSQAHRRLVRSVGADAMSYATNLSGMPVTIKLATWHDWVRKTRAVRL